MLKIIFSKKALCQTPVLLSFFTSFIILVLGISFPTVILFTYLSQHQNLYHAYGQWPTFALCIPRIVSIFTCHLVNCNSHITIIGSRTDALSTTHCGFQNDNSPILSDSLTYPIDCMDLYRLTYTLYYAYQRVLRDTSLLNFLNVSYSKMELK